MSTENWLNLADLDRTFGGRRPLIRKLLTVFVQTYADFPELMQQLADKDDSHNFAMQLHSLKGASASLGAEQLRTRVTELEAAFRADSASRHETVRVLVSFWPAVMQNARSVLTELDD